MSSVYFSDLLTGYKSLKKIFLPRKISPIGAYTDEQFEKVAAFRILMHAEFEFYFEENAFHIAEVALDNWKKKKIVSKVLLGLMAYYSGEAFKPIPNSLRDNNHTSEDLYERVKISYTSYIKSIKGNNGIKEYDIIKMYLPISFNIKDFDQTWLNILSSYCSIRGDFAHKSMRVNKKLDPKDEIDTVNSIILGIESFDALVNK